MSNVWSVIGHRIENRHDDRWVYQELSRVTHKLIDSNMCSRILTGLEPGPEMDILSIIETVIDADDIDGTNYVRKRVAPFEAMIVWPHTVSSRTTLQKVSWWTALGRAEHITITDAYEDAEWWGRLAMRLGRNRFNPRITYPNRTYPEPPNETVITEGYKNRNRVMVDRSDGVIVVDDGLPAIQDLLAYSAETSKQVIRIDVQGRSVTKRTP